MCGLAWRPEEETRLAHQLPDALPGQTPGARAQKQERGILFLGNHFPAVFQVLLQGLLGGHTEGHHALLVALAAHQDVSHVELQVFETRVADFGDAYASGVEKFDHGAIAERRALALARFHCAALCGRESLRPELFRTAWLRLRRGSAPWGAPSTASAGRCSGSDPCQSFHRAANGDKDGGWPTAFFPPSGRRAHWKIIPECIGARLRAVLRSEECDASRETRRTARGRWCTRRWSTSPSPALRAGSRGRQKESASWRLRP